MGRYFQLKFVCPLSKVACNVTSVISLRRCSSKCVLVDVISNISSWIKFYMFPPILNYKRFHVVVSPCRWSSYSFLVEAIQNVISWMIPSVSSWMLHQRPCVPCIILILMYQCNSNNWLFKAIFDFEINTTITIYSK